MRERNEHGNSAAWTSKLKLARFGVQCFILTTITSMVCAQTLGLAQSINIPFGSLIIVLTGLPDTSSAEVTITGSNGRPQTFTVTGMSRPTLRLQAGTYTVTAAAVADFSTPVEQTVTVAPGQTATITLAYTPIPPPIGSLEVVLSGLPDAISANVTLTRTDGRQKTIPVAASRSSTLSLPAGTYTVTGADVAGFSTPAGQTVAVTPGQTATVTLAYTQIQPTGSVEVGLSGVPDTSSVDVTVAGKDGSPQTLTLIGSSRRTLQLPAGTYTVTGAALPGFSTSAGQTVTVEPSQRAVVTLAYTANPQPLPWILLVLGILVALTLVAVQLGRGRVAGGTSAGIKTRIHQTPGTQMIRLAGITHPSPQQLTLPQIRVRTVDDHGFAKITSPRGSLFEDKAAGHV